MHVLFVMLESKERMGIKEREFAPSTMMQNHKSRKAALQIETV